MLNDPRKIRVCFVVDYFQLLGGVQTVVNNLAKHLNKKIIKIDIVALKGLCDLSTPPDVRVISLDSGRIRKSVSRLSEYLRLERPDIILGSYEEVAAVTILAKFSAGVSSPIIWWQHTHFTRQLRFNSQNIIEYIGKYILYFTAARFASHFIAVSQGVKRNLSRALLIPMQSITYLKNPDTLDTTETINDGSNSTEKPRFIFIGRLSKQKQVDHILEAISLFPEDMNVELEIIGDGDQRQPLENIAAKLPQRHKILFRGAVNDPWKDRKRPAVLILSSLYEGYGMVLIEAKKRGIPCITYDTPSGPSEIVTDGIDGIVVPEQNIPKLAEAMQEIWRNSLLFNSLQKGAIGATSTLDPRAPYVQFEEFIIRNVERSK
jgi:glycosyltransferase involved in cell wall biosynthesis